MWDDLITQSKYPLLKILFEKITIQNMEKLELKLFQCFYNVYNIYVLGFDWSESLVFCSTY